MAPRNAAPMKKRARTPHAKVGFLNRLSGRMGLSWRDSTNRNRPSAAALRANMPSTTGLVQAYVPSAPKVRASSSGTLNTMISSAPR